MSQYYETGHRAFLTAGAALGKYTRVKLSGSTPNTIALATATDQEIGVVTRQTFSTDTQADVLLTTNPGTVPMVASGAVTVNATVYSDASGKVSSTGAGTTASEVQTVLSP
jgi:hypothetical protein